jgi:ribonuclease HI
MHKVRLTTDGSCVGNRGPGGWACLLRCGGDKRVLCGEEKKTTNNRMELVAVIQGLRALNQPCEVEVVTDSQYVQRSMSEWLERWQEAEWVTSKGEPVANRATLGRARIAGTGPQDPLALGSRSRARYGPAAV